MDEANVRKKILQKLRERNNKQCHVSGETFTSLIQSHNRLLQTSEDYRSRSLQLTVEVEKLKQENLELQVRAEAGVGTGGKGGDRNKVLEQKTEKLYKIQEELTELHKKKGENAQQIIDLNNAVQEKEKELKARDLTILEMENNLAALQEANKNLEQSLIEATTANQMLTDEQQALQLAFTSLEGKFRKCQEDNNDLVSRWMALKSRDADLINAQNEKDMQRRKEKMEQELQQAIKDTPVVTAVPDYGPAAPIVACVSIPSRALYQFDAHEGEVNAVKWSPSGRLFATGGADRKLKLWHVVNGKCESHSVLTGSNAALMSIEYDLEESLVLVASADFASRVWTTADNRLRHTITGHSGKVLAAKFLGDPNMVVSGSYDRTLKIWDLRRAACIKTIFAMSSCNDLVTSDGLGTNIISGHFDRKVRFWDTRTESTAKEITLQGKVTSLDISPDRTCLLSCSRDDSIKLIDLRMNTVTGTLSADGFHVPCDWSRATFSPDGQYVMAGSADGGVYIWNVAKKKVEKVLRDQGVVVKREPPSGHASGSAVVACSWHPAGSMLLSCDKQRKVTLWSDF